MNQVAIIFFSLLLSGCTVYGQSVNNKPFVIGEIAEIQSVQLSEKRVLNIYLPDGYKANDTIEYPVIYLLDGSAQEDFIHIVGLVQYFNFPWINSLPKSIVVGIENVDRRRDFTYPTSIEKDKISYPTTGGSKKFIAFLEKELQPFIESKYRTGKAKTLIGESLGGLLATEILFTVPTLFNTYIIVSPSLWWNNGSLLKMDPEILKADFAQRTSIYIGVGKEGLVPGLSKHIMEKDVESLANMIRQTKSKNIKVVFDYLPNETHATIIHPAVFNAFRLLYPSK